MVWIHSFVAGFCGVDIFIFLEGKIYENFWVFPQRIWILKKKFRMAVCRTVTDNLESQRVKWVNREYMGYMGPGEKVLFMQ